MDMFFITVDCISSQEKWSNIQIPLVLKCRSKSGIKLKMVSDIIRNKITRHFTGLDEIVFKNDIPSYKKLEINFSALNELGIYLHIPFCDRICGYCPYNKEVFSEEACINYVKAVIREIDFYLPLTDRIPITSFYIGGGTPTTMLKKGIDTIINYIFKHFNMKCYVHMESHPNHLTNENLGIIESLGVKYLSIGVEAFQDHHLKTLGRPYSAEQVKKNIEETIKKNFECVNIDLIFDLPGQSESELENAGHEIIKLGVQQAATYPLFRFRYTNMGKEFNDTRGKAGTILRRRKFLRILEDIFYSSEYYRSSVWAFTKKGVDKYCSVTVPVYLGFGASASSYLRDIFFVNTFRVKEYIKAVNDTKSPVALSINLSDEMQMAGWLYWRVYETAFKKSDFYKRFNVSFDEKYGPLMKVFNCLGYLQVNDDQIRLTNRGAYWIHAFEDFFSINYISKLWGTSKDNPWPEKVIL
jgi:coproporphyrinogen III oxidase-like Fe-S oxidoreductase